MKNLIKHDLLTPRTSNSLSSIRKIEEEVEVGKVEYEVSFLKVVGSV